MPAKASPTLWVLALAFLIAACSDATGLDSSPSFAAAISRDHAQTELHDYQWVGCANGGDGETVELTGTLHVLTTETTDSEGGVHTQRHFQPMGVEGLGLESGDMWRGVGETRTTWNEVAGGAADVETYVSNYKIVGTGGQQSLMWHVTVHVTTDPNGDVQADVYTESLDCS